MKSLQSKPFKPLTRFTIYCHYFLYLLFYCESTQIDVNSHLFVSIRLTNDWIKRPKKWWSDWLSVIDCLQLVNWFIILTTIVVLIKAFTINHNQWSLESPSSDQMGNCLKSVSSHDDISLLRENTSNTRESTSSDQLASQFGPPPTYQVSLIGLDLS